MAKQARKAKNAPARSRTKVAAGEGVQAPLVFRPSLSVRTLVTASATNAGHTLSSEIDEALRRAYWREDAYLAAMTRTFGGEQTFALAYLVARMIAGIEHEMQATAAHSEAVAIQVDEASKFLLGAVFASWRRKPGPMLMPTPTVPARYQPASTETGDEEQSAPWIRVITAINRNLTSPGTILWWPLSDSPETGKPTRATEPPLRPNKAALVAVWPADAIAV